MMQEGALTLLNYIIYILQTWLTNNN